jgi:hypothetical protein
MWNKGLRRLALAASLGWRAGAQDTPPPINTDRPAVTDSSVVVPAGSLQVENGLLVSTSDGSTTLDAPETLIRFGVAGKTELRFTAPDFYQNLSGVSLRGFGDLAAGVKQQLGPLPGGFDLSLVVFCSFPTGARGISSHGYDPGMQAPWSRSLSKNWTAAGMLSLYLPTEGHTRNLTGESTFLIDRQIAGPLDAFIEYAGDFPESGSARHLLHIGAAYKITARQQIDAHFGAGLSRAAPDHFIGFGYSFRVQALAR